MNIIWVGDESKRPDRLINTWRKHYDVRLWCNKDLAQRKWFLGNHIRHYIKRGEWNGVADCMRWELLYEHGGVWLDADSECLLPLPDWLWDCYFAGCWENEVARPGLIACGMLAARKECPFIGRIIASIYKDSTDERMAWDAVGPMAITREHTHGDANVTILPSHFFIPEHFTGVKYNGGAPVYARQHWGSTHDSY